MKESDLKVGDKLFCIKTFNNVNKILNKYCISHEKGETYKIVKINYHTNATTYIYITAEEKSTINGYLGFIFDEYDKNIHNNLQTYFITLQELRKEKLNEIGICR